jgi:hypothetical protein
LRVSRGSFRTPSKRVAQPLDGATEINTVLDPCERVLIGIFERSVNPVARSAKTHRFPSFRRMIVIDTGRFIAPSVASEMLCGVSDRNEARTRYFLVE